ncbi:hypothetical protein P280DRAFT_479500 [Massarina eburnea CBS 473.64]|uniref:Uncharacterized protein n=1 Tax=Massarina eburnea CBS 473.64 TaxID=1395130 RepID=A0A6A6S127_9PLEO|nr:hypothetical protein P280DRAFT_479500 [Massarina eburnea CBS 473.64]
MNTSSTFSASANQINGMSPSSTSSSTAEEYQYATSSVNGLLSYLTEARNNINSCIPTMCDAIHGGAFHDYKYKVASKSLYEALRDVSPALMRLTEFGSKFVTAEQLEQYLGPQGIGWDWHGMEKVADMLRGYADFLEDQEYALLASLDGLIELLRVTRSAVEERCSIKASPHKPFMNPDSDSKFKKDQEPFEEKNHTQDELADAMDIDSCEEHRPHYDPLFPWGVFGGRSSSPTSTASSPSVSALDDMSSLLSALGDIADTPALPRTPEYKVTKLHQPSPPTVAMAFVSRTKVETLKKTFASVKMTPSATRAINFLLG